MKIRYPKKFKTILIDPPWYDQGGGKIVRGANAHYGILKKEGILEVILNSGVWNPDMLDGCHLYMWVTNNRLFDSAPWLLEQLDFQYVTNLAWAKLDRFGLGYYFRGRHELCLFARPKIRVGRSILRPLVHNEDTLIEPRNSKQIIHSEKPKDLYRKIERVSPGPRLEMFARERREGWISWGNELPTV